MADVAHSTKTFSGRFRRRAPPHSLRPLRRTPDLFAASDALWRHWVFNYQKFCTRAPPLTISWVLRKERPLHFCRSLNLFTCGNLSILDHLVSNYFIAWRCNTHNSNELTNPKLSALSCLYTSIAMLRTIRISWAAWRVGCSRIPGGRVLISIF
jgi:hypothetical protein